MKALIFFLFVSSFSYSQNELTHFTEPELKPLQEWNISYDTDLNDGLSVTTAKVLSLNNYELTEEKSMAMLLVLQKRGLLTISMFTNNLEYNSEKNSLWVTFDNEAPVQFTYSIEEVEGSKPWIQITDNLKFRSKLESSKVTKISADYTGVGDLAFEFNTEDFNLVRFTE